MPAQPLRHLFEDAALLTRKALNASLRNLVEHTIELLGLRFAAARRRRQRRGPLRADCFALRDDVIDLVAALATRKIARNGARWLVGLGKVGDTLSNLIDPGRCGHAHVDVRGND